MFPEIYIEGSVTEIDETKEEAFIESWGYPTRKLPSTTTNLRPVVDNA
jgi:hypothetical protein